MTAGIPKSIRFLFFACLFGVPYSIFYYPIDIYGWLPVWIFAGAATAAQALLIVMAAVARKLGIRKAESGGLSRRAKTTIYGGAVIVFLAILLFSGLLGQFIFIAIRFVINPLFYIGILWSLSMSWFAGGVAAGIAVGVLGGRKHGARGAFAGVFMGFWTLCCFALVFFSVFKAGPGKASCAKLEFPAGVNKILSREQIDALPGLSGALPYDAAKDGEDKYLFISLKQTRARPGGIAMMDLKSKKVISSFLTESARRGWLRANEFPERMSVNAVRRELYTIVLSPGNYYLLVLSYADGRLNLVNRVALRGEPNNVYADAKRDRVFVFYAGSDMYGFDVYEGATTATRRSFKLFKEVRAPELKGSIQQVVEDEKTGHIFITNLGPRHIVEIDPESMKLVKAYKDTLPVESIAIDSSRRRIFATGPFSRKLVAIDADNFSVLSRRRIGCGLADAIYDGNGHVAVGGYTGEVDIFSDETRDVLKMENRFYIGRLLRNLSQGSPGKFFACSGCGVFEIESLH